MMIFIGADYRGIERKKIILDFLAEKNLDFADLGDYDANIEDDFNDPAIKVAEAVRENLSAFGILICDSAHGMTIQANRFRGVRAAHCFDTRSAILAREHDDANILCMSAHFLEAEQMTQIIDAFLNTKFQNLERRVRRINRLDEGVNYD